MPKKKRKSRDITAAQEAMFPLTLKAVLPGPPSVRRYDAILVKAGRVRRRDGKPSNWIIADDAVKAAPKLFQGVAVFVDHPDFFASGRSVRALMGTTENDIHYDARSLVGTIRLYNTADKAWAIQLLDQWLADKKAGLPVPRLGLSAVFWGPSEIVGDDRITTSFRAVESVDIVFDPGASGAVRAALQATIRAMPKGESATMKKKKKKRKQITTVATTALAPPVTPLPATPQPPPFVIPPAVITPAQVSGVPTLQPIHPGWTNEQDDLLRRTQGVAHEMLVSQSGAFLGAQLQVVSTILPPESLALLRQQFSGRTFAPSDLEAAITQQRNLVAALTQHSVVSGIGESEMTTSMEQIELAFEKLMGLPVDQPVHNLLGIKDFYLKMTGDYEMTGIFDPDKAMLATTSADVANITANVMNKILMKQWIAMGAAGYNWYETVCDIQEFQSLQPIDWVSIDGFANLPTVAEGDPYTELDFDDSKEEADWNKTGGWVGPTLEAIDRDNIGALKAIPKVLATAGIRTISAAVAALMTANDGLGQLLDDGYYLFDETNHLNLMYQHFDADNWELAVQLMFRQTEAGSEKYLGIKPRYVLVAIEGEGPALEVFDSEVVPKEGAFYKNVRRSSPDNVIVVPDWTDPYDWVALADQTVLPALGLAFRWGRYPQLVTVVNPASGLMFTNDIMPIKVRLMFGCGIISHRGIIKSRNA